MARMYPERAPELITAEDRRRKLSEKRIYDLLRMRLSDSYIVFWGVPWLAKSQTGEARDGEVDFVVIHREHGVLIIEVKGGSIKRDGRTGKWTSTDMNGVPHDISPFDQAARNARALKSKLTESNLTAPYSYPIARAVWFPTLSIAGLELGTNAPRDIILDMYDFNDPQAAILRAFDYCLGAKKTLLSQAAIDAVIRLLGPTFEISTPLGAEISHEKEHMRQLTEGQFTVLDELASHRRALISGIAGSGKTMLALEKARRLANEGYEVLLTCFNRPLANFLSESLSREQGIMVSTFSKLCELYAEAAGIDLAPYRNLPEYLAERLPELLVEAIDSVSTRFDAIVVDEGMDFKTKWWTALEFTFRKPDDGIWYIFFDDNQRIYTDESEVLPFKQPLYHLTVNCRNTQAIYRQVRQYYRGNYQIACQGAEGRNVEIRPIPDMPEAAHKALSRILHELVYENVVPSRDIVILTPIKANSLWQEGSQHGNFTITRRPELRGSPNTIFCSTIQAFKGLESPVVILTEMHHAWRNVDTLRYIAVSRATSHLILLEQA